MLERPYSVPSLPDYTCYSKCKIKIFAAQINIILRWPVEAEGIACKTYSSVKSQLTNKGNSIIYKKLKQNNRQKSSVGYNIGSEKRYPYFLSGASAHC